MMGKEIRRRTKCGSAAVLILCLLLASVCGACGVIKTSEAAEKTLPSASETAERTISHSSEEKSNVQEPEWFTLCSVYTSTIPNPDCGGEIADEIISIELRNDSQRYLHSAHLTATMSDGSTARFIVCDIPAGEIVDAFAIDNASLAADVSCVSVCCDTAEFLDGDMLMTDRVRITAGKTGAVLTNISSEPLENLTVVYHCDLDGRYFGGLSYETTIEYLAPGADFEITDLTIFGKLFVVRVCNND